MNLKTSESHKRKKLVGPKGTREDSAGNQCRCARCGGAMIFERFLATMEIFHAWRCLNCGEIMDPVVQKNREQVMAQKKQAV